MTDEEYLKESLKIADSSNDPNTKVGAIIVPNNDKGIFIFGYNHFPHLVRENDRIQDKEAKLKIIIHAEMNALLNCFPGFYPYNATLYLAAKSTKTGLIWGGSPCTNCTKHIIQAGIRKIVTYPFKNVPSSWYEDITFARALLEEAGVEYKEIENASN